MAEEGLKAARVVKVKLSSFAGIAGFKLTGGESMLASRSAAALLGLPILRLVFGMCDGGHKSAHPSHERFCNAFC